MNANFDIPSLKRMMHTLDQRYVKAGLLPHISVSITGKNGILFSERMGFADIESGTEITAGHHYRIYSMTKPLTCLALMQLYERGLVNLNAPVSEFFPEFSQMSIYQSGEGATIKTTPATTAITLHHLLTHMSGLTYGFNESNPVENLYHQQKVDFVSHLTRDQWIKAISAMPLLFEPGTAWNYGVSTDVIGFVVEVVSGLSLETYFRQEILDPLGMTETRFQYRGDPAQMTSCYVTQNGQRTRHDAFDNSEFSKLNPSASGGSGLVSTEHDYLQFMRMLLNQGELNGQRIIGRKTLHFMHQNHLPNGQGMVEHSRGGFTEVRHRGFGYGLGFSHRYDVAASGVNGSHGEFGWGGMAGTNFWIDPIEQFGVLFLTQLLPSSAYDIRSDLRAMIYGALK